MLEEPCIIQMNIDRYTAMLQAGPSEEYRALIEKLLAESRIQFAEAVGRLARSIDPGGEATAIPIQP